MANLKALHLHVNFQVGGIVTDDPENPTGYSQPMNVVLDFGNEPLLEEQLTKYPWLAGLIKPVIESLHAIYEEKLVADARPKEKTEALKTELQGLI